MNVSERPVEVKTPDGVADGYFYEASEPGRPGIVFLPDGIGLRDSQRQMARRIAELGYDVLLPNIYYRNARPPIFDHHPNLNEEKDRARFAELTGALNPDAIRRDGSAYVDFLVPQTVAVIGFCFSGQFALRVAAARPDRVALAASFHGGRLYTDDPASPHRELPRVAARLYFGHAKDDRSMPPEAIAKLDEALRAWGGEFESETYDARHGWTVPDSAAYDRSEAERAFRKQCDLFAATLRVTSETP